MNAASLRAADAAGRASAATRPVLRRARGATGPVLRRAGQGQARLWKWAALSLLVTRGAPVVPGALAAVHLIPALLLAAWVPLFSGASLFLACLAVVAVGLGLLAAPKRPAPVDDHWWSEQRLVRALLDAGVLPAPRKDQPLPTLSRRGQPTHDATGTAVTIALPLGRTAADVIAARDRLSGSLGIEALRVWHVTGKPANVVRLLALAPRSPGSTPAEVGFAARTRWADAVRIGTTELGQPVTLATFEANTLLAGQPGAGKTTVARTVLGHYLLDPDAEVYALDGKSSRRDYGAAVPLCRRFVWGTDETAVEDAVAMLEDVLAVVRTRNAASDVQDQPGGVLLLLEELQDVRAAADKATRERLDALLGRIVRMGRAVGVSVLVSTQRPSVDDLPSGVRNLVGQRLALMLRNGADAALVLGAAPDLPMPTRRGEALLTTPTGTVAVRLDLLDDGAWTALCARAAALRAGTPEPLLPAVRELLAVEPLSASVLLDLLPSADRPASARQLGAALAARPDAFQQVRTRDGRRWTSVNGPDSLSQSLPAPSTAEHSVSTEPAG